MTMQNDDLSLDDFMPEFEPPADDLVAAAGTPLPEGAKAAEADAVVAAMSSVYDPEIPVNIYELGLVYDHPIAADGSVAIRMTLTAPGCPVAGILPQEVADAVAAVDGVGEVAVTLVWDPPWNKDMMSEAAKLELGFL